MPKEKTKEQRIKTEWSRLKAIYSDLPDNKKAIVFPLLQNLAFMKITLDDLQQSINENGCSEDYKNGENQYGRKAAADLQAYNSLPQRMAEEFAGQRSDGTGARCRDGFGGKSHRHHDHDCTQAGACAAHQRRGRYIYSRKCDIPRGGHR